MTLPAEESASKDSPQGHLRSGICASSSSKIENTPLVESSKPHAPSKSSRKPRKQHYPLYPSIALLLREHGLSSSEADNIPASGPKGRLLKGDVLGYLGRISSTYSSQQSTRITKLENLDLSNVNPALPKVMAPNQSSKTQPQKAPEPETEPIDTEIAIPVSLSSVISVQKRMQAALGVTLPLSIFVARATELANDDLPRSAATRPSVDELFNDVLGLNNISTKALRGNYLPQMTALPAKPFMERARLQKPPDVYELLTGKSSTLASTRGFRNSPPDIMASSKPVESTNVFSVSAAKGDEKRARTFLERVKTILQVEPGRLVL